MMIIRIAIRSPMMFIFSIVMAFLMSPRLAWIFVIVLPILVGGLIIIISKAIPFFNRIFKKYDAMNESVQENVKAMRVVKAYVREEHESENSERLPTACAPTSRKRNACSPSTRRSCSFACTWSC